MEKYRISVSRSLAVIDWSDAPAPKVGELREAMQQAVETPGFHNGTPLLCTDMGTGFDPSPGVVECVSELLTSFAPHFGNRMALLVTKDVHFGVGRMIEAHCDVENVGFRVFREREEAEAWLGATKRGKGAAS